MAERAQACRPVSHPPCLKGGRCHCWYWCGSRWMSSSLFALALTLPAWALVRRLRRRCHRTRSPFAPQGRWQRAWVVGRLRRPRSCLPARPAARPDHRRPTRCRRPAAAFHQQRPVAYAQVGKRRCVVRPPDRAAAPQPAGCHRWQPAAAARASSPMPVRDCPMWAMSRC